jgi:hypothetical protein
VLASAWKDFGGKKGKQKMGKERLGEDPKRMEQFTKRTYQ